MTEVRTLVVPQRSSGDALLTNRLKQRATEFLRLVDQECQHHQHRKDRRQILLAMPEVMPELVALILQRIECFVFDLPTRTTASNQMTCVVRSDGQIGDPTEAFANRAVRHRLGVLQKVDQEIRIRFIERQLVCKTNFTLYFFLLRVLGPAEPCDATF